MIYLYQNKKTNEKGRCPKNELILLVTGYFTFFYFGVGIQTQISKSIK